MTRVIVEKNNSIKHLSLPDKVWFSMLDNIIWMLDNIYVFCLNLMNFLQMKIYAEAAFHQRNKLTNTLCPHLI